ncbi:hypothetical protein B4119_2120 [Parageobacillus caldoxylosilyticus]|uniref:Uncharacterized protein n=1 Tax=Saccharococcus caldoxylosilyticus TaxID=81408 RepID=A0A150LYS7_9BACL|nr:hypothetical protein B4119_2120 [Parageobacillus caldoxylosilyticus]
MLTFYCPPYGCSKSNFSSVSYSTQRMNANDLLCYIMYSYIIQMDRKLAFFICCYCLIILLAFGTPSSGISLRYSNIVARSVNMSAAQTIHSFLSFILQYFSLIRCLYYLLMYYTFI